MIVTSKVPPTTSKLPDWMQDYQAMHRRQSAAPFLISQDDDSNLSHLAEDQPAYNLRSKRSTPTITQEALSACIQMSQTHLDPQQTAARKYPLSLLCEMAGAVLDGTTGDLLEYRHLIRLLENQEVLWGKAFGKEIGRLAQGLPGIVEGTNTIDFISKSDVPKDRFRDYALTPG